MIVNIESVATVLGMETLTKLPYFFVQLECKNAPLCMSRGFFLKSVQPLSRYLEELHSITDKSPFCGCAEGIYGIFGRLKLPSRYYQCKNIYASESNRMKDKESNQLGYDIWVLDPLLNPKH